MKKKINELPEAETGDTEIPAFRVDVSDIFVEPSLSAQRVDDDFAEMLAPFHTRRSVPKKVVEN